MIQIPITIVLWWGYAPLATFESHSRELFLIKPSIYIDFIQTTSIQQQGYRIEQVTHLCWKTGRAYFWKKYCLYSKKVSGFTLFPSLQCVFAPQFTILWLISMWLASLTWAVIEMICNQSYSMGVTVDARCIVWVINIWEQLKITVCGTSGLF